MIIISKQTFEVTNPSTGEKMIIRNQDIVTPPEWVANDPYFKALCDADQITCHIDSKSAEVQAVADEAEKPKRGKK